MFKSKRTEEKTTALTAEEWAKYIAGKKGAYTVAYRTAHGAGFDGPANALQGFKAFAECVAKGHITPGNGRRLTVLGPDTDRIEDIRDPLPNRGELIEWAGSLFPALPPLVFPRPTTDPVLDPAPLQSGYVRMDGAL